LKLFENKVLKWGKPEAAKPEAEAKPEAAAKPEAGRR
jgi:hypothetical protein